MNMKVVDLTRRGEGICTWQREWIIGMHGVGLGLAVAEEGTKGFHSIISIDNCEGCVKRCLAVNPSKPLSRGSHSFHSTLFSQIPFSITKINIDHFIAKIHIWIDNIFYVKFHVLCEYIWSYMMSSEHG